MWHQKGVYETDNTKGVFFGALDVADSESLADLITLDKGLKKLGALPDDKEKITPSDRQPPIDEGIKKLLAQ